MRQSYHRFFSRKSNSRREGGKERDFDGWYELQSGEVGGLASGEVGVADEDSRGDVSAQLKLRENEGGREGIKGNDFAMVAVDKLISSCDECQR